MNGDGASSLAGDLDPCLGIMHLPNIFLLVLPIPAMTLAMDR